MKLPTLAMFLACLPGCQPAPPSDAQLHEHMTRRGWHLESHPGALAAPADPFAPSVDLTNRAARAWGVSPRTLRAAIAPAPDAWHAERRLDALAQAARLSGCHERHLAAALADSHAQAARHGVPFEQHLALATALAYPNPPAPRTGQRLRAALSALFDTPGWTGPGTALERLVQVQAWCKAHPTPGACLDAAVPDPLARQALADLLQPRALDLACQLSGALACSSGWARTQMAGYPEPTGPRTDPEAWRTQAVLESVLRAWVR